LNELVLAVDTAGYNESDYGTAAARLKKHVLDSCTFFDAVGCRKVVVCNTGDAINSDRRLDEVLANAGNRSRALIVSVDLIQQVLMELSEKYVVTYVTVGGNESRKHDDITWTDKTFGNNYDVDIHYMLQRLCGTNTRITFASIQSSVEQVVTINNKNILLVHGHMFKSSDIESSITKLYAKYAKAGILINYVISGHVHATLNSDFFSRSSSLVGDNAYSSGCLLLRGKAGQNIYIITEDSIIPIAIDLQEVSPKDGAYDFDKEFAEGTMQMKSRLKSESRIPINIITI
jgi:predicted phosphodiesterase